MLDFTNNCAIKVITTPSRTISYHFASANDPSPGNIDHISTSDGVTLKYVYDGDLLTDVIWSGAIAGAIHRTYDNNFRIFSEWVNNEPVISFLYDDDGLLFTVGSIAYYIRSPEWSIQRHHVG